MTGAVIALLVREPALAVPLSFFSHYVCDAIPHFGGPDDDEKPDLFTKKFSIILGVDFLVAVSIMVVLGFLFPHERGIIWVCMVAAAIPDITSAYYRLYIEHIKKRKRHFDPISAFHHKIQWSQTYPGAFVEVIWFISMGAVILSRR